MLREWTGVTVFEKMEHARKRKSIIKDVEDPDMVLDRKCRDLWRLRDRNVFLSFSELGIDVDICFGIVEMDNEGIILNIVSSIDCRHNNEK